jgi:hypothetical protein
VTRGLVFPHLKNAAHLAPYRKELNSLPTRLARPVRHAACSAMGSSEAAERVALREAYREPARIATVPPWPQA